MRRDKRNPAQQRRLRATTADVLRTAVHQGSIDASTAALILGAGVAPDADPEVGADPEPTSLAAPDPYKAGIARLRAARGKSDVTRDALADRLVNMEMFRQDLHAMASVGHAAAVEPSTSAVHREPPNPYSEDALRARREGRR